MKKIIFMIILLLVCVFFIYLYYSNSTDNSDQEISAIDIQPGSEINTPASTGQPKAGDIINNSIDMKLVYIPAGEFMMGSEDGSADARPVHKVTLTNGFWMGQTELTQAQYLSVMGTNPSEFKDDNNPVECVSWNKAVEFCQKLSQKEGKTYRLPTEAEWEYACKAGTTTAYNTDDEISTDLANYNGEGRFVTKFRGINRAKTTPVASFKPNDFSLYDMHGNIMEWCSDWYDENYYSNSPSVDPQGPDSGIGRVFRGGAWKDSPVNCKSASRNCISETADFNYNGFRVVLQNAG